MKVKQSCLLLAYMSFPRRTTRCSDKVSALAVHMVASQFEGIMVVLIHACKLHFCTSQDSDHINISDAP